MRRGFQWLEISFYEFARLATWLVGSHSKNIWSEVNYYCMGTDAFAYDYRLAKQLRKMSIVKLFLLCQLSYHISFLKYHMVTSIINDFLTDHKVISIDNDFLTHHMFIVNDNDFFMPATWLVGSHSEIPRFGINYFFLGYLHFWV